MDWNIKLTKEEEEMNRLEKENIDDFADDQSYREKNIYITNPVKKEE